MAQLTDTGQRSWSVNLYGDIYYGTERYGTEPFGIPFYLEGLVQNNHINTQTPTIVWTGPDVGIRVFDLKLIFPPAGYEFSKSGFTLVAGKYTLKPQEALPESLEGDWIARSRSKYADSTWSDWVEVPFVLDLTVPVTPTLDPVTTPTIVSSQLLTGTKQPGDKVLVNGIEARYPLGLLEHLWEYNFQLATGTNNFTIVGVDPTGNVSLPLDSSIMLLVLELSGDKIERINVWNAFDELGMILNTPRLPGEENLNYKNRLLRYFK